VEENYWMAFSCLEIVKLFFLDKLGHRGDFKGSKIRITIGFHDILTSKLIPSVLRSKIKSYQLLWVFVGESGRNRYF
jgi:hypothetical protein